MMAMMMVLTYQKSMKEVRGCIDDSGNWGLHYHDHASATAPIDLDYDDDDDDDDDEKYHILEI